MAPKYTTLNDFDFDYVRRAIKTNITPLYDLSPCCLFLLIFVNIFVADDQSIILCRTSEEISARFAATNVFNVVSTGAMAPNFLNFLSSPATGSGESCEVPQWESYRLRPGHEFGAF